MPWINASTGESCMGRVALTSVDGVVPINIQGTEAFGPHWLEEAGRVLIYQQNSNQPHPFLQTYDLDTDATATADLNGTSDMSAGGGVWAAFRSSGGVRTSIPGVGPFTVAGLCEVSTAGQIATVTNINTGGLTVYDNTGARIWSTSTVVSGTYPQRLRSNLMSWRAGASEWQLWNITTNTPVAWSRQNVGVFSLCPVTLAAGPIYLMEMTEEGTDQVLWVRQKDAAFAYRITTGPVNWPDIVEEPGSPGSVRVAWSTTVAEGVTRLRVAILNLSSGAFQLGTTDAGPLAFTTETPLSLTPVAVTPYAQGTGGMELPVLHAPFTSPKTGLLTSGSAWGEAWVRRVSRGMGGMNTAGNLTGIVDPAHGGTGVTTGLTILDAANLVGIVPAETLENVQQVGFWSPVVAGPALNFAEIIAQAGSWSPLMTGPDAATSELVLTAEGDTIAVFEQAQDGPWIPNFVVNSFDDAVVAYQPTPGEGIE